MNFIRGLFPEWAVEWPKNLNMPLNKWTNDFVEWLVTEYGVIFETASDGILVVLVGLERFLRDLPWLVVFAGVGALTYFSSGRKRGLTALVAACMFLIGVVDPQALGFIDDDAFGDAGLHHHLHRPGAFRSASRSRETTGCAVWCCPRSTSCRPCRASSISFRRSCSSAWARCPPSSPR